MEQFEDCVADYEEAQRELETIKHDVVDNEY